MTLKKIISSTVLSIILACGSLINASQSTGSVLTSEAHISTADQCTLAAAMAEFNEQCIILARLIGRRNHLLQGVLERCVEVNEKTFTHLIEYNKPVSALRDNFKGAIAEFKKKLVCVNISDENDTFWDEETSAFLKECKKDMLSAFARRNHVALCWYALNDKEVVRNIATVLLGDTTAQLGVNIDLEEQEKERFEEFLSSSEYDPENFSKAQKIADDLYYVAGIIKSIKLEDEQVDELKNKAIKKLDVLLSCETDLDKKAEFRNAKNELLSFSLKKHTMARLIAYAVITQLDYERVCLSKQNIASKIIPKPQEKDPIKPQLSSSDVGLMSKVATIAKKYRYVAAGVGAVACAYIAYKYFYAPNNDAQGHDDQCSSAKEGVHAQ